MIVYHGSNHRFQKLRISKSLVERKSTLENEGCGIYFSTDRTVAESYGKYVYTLEINDTYFQDFRKQEVCENYINQLQQYILSKTNINLHDYIDFESIITYAKCGGIAISGIGHELYLMLDSTESFYTSLSDTKRKQLYRILNQYDKHNLNAYMFTYHIPNIGVIKNINSDIVTIIKRESR